jgi:hypothetical protein
MNGYESSTPRIALGLTAVAMSAITMGAMVVLPAKLEFVDAEPYALAAAKTVTIAPIEIATSPARIDKPEVVIREDHVNPDCTTQGAQSLVGKRHRLSSRG